MTWKEDIETLVNHSFNKEWFETIKNRFEGNAYYSSEKDLILNPKGYLLLTEGGEHIWVTNEVDFFQYCWNGIDDNIGEPDTKYETEKNLLPRYHIARKLEHTIKFHFPVGDIDRSCKLVDASIEYIYVLFDDLQSQFQNENYQQLMAGMSVKLDDWIRARTEDVFAVSELNASTRDRLEFRLLQNELAALIVLISDSFLELNDPRERISKNAFFEKHFYCSKRLDKGEFTAMKDISKKLSKTRTGHNRESIVEVFKKLQTTYKSLTYE